MDFSTTLRYEIALIFVGRYDILITKVNLSFYHNFENNFIKL